MFQIIFIARNCQYIWRDDEGKDKPKENSFTCFSLEFRNLPLNDAFYYNKPFRCLDGSFYQVKITNWCLNFTKHH